MCSVMDVSAMRLRSGPWRGVCGLLACCGRGRGRGREGGCRGVLPFKSAWGLVLSVHTGLGRMGVRLQESVFVVGFLAYREVHIRCAEHYFN